MIKIEELTDEDVGKEVRYEDHGYVEFGRITSWNSEFVFVRYHTKRFHNGREMARAGTTSEATSPKDLAFT